MVDTNIAGSSHHKGRSHIPMMRPGDPLTLIREPHNRFDRKAIAVYRGSAQLGYLPREMAAKIAIVMDCGVPVKAIKSSRSWGAILLEYEEQPYE